MSWPDLLAKSPQATATKAAKTNRGWMYADHRTTTATPEGCCDNTIKLHKRKALLIAVSQTGQGRPGGSEYISNFKARRCRTWSPTYNGAIGGPLTAPTSISPTSATALTLRRRLVVAGEPALDTYTGCGIRAIRFPQLTAAAQGNVSVLEPR